MDESFDQENDFAKAEDSQVTYSKSHTASKQETHSRCHKNAVQAPGWEFKPHWAAPHHAGLYDLYIAGDTVQLQPVLALSKPKAGAAVRLIKHGLQASL